MWVVGLEGKKGEVSGIQAVKCVRTQKPSGWHILNEIKIKKELQDVNLSVIL